MFVPIVRFCLLAGCVSTACNVIPDVLRGRNFINHIHLSMPFFGPRPAPFIEHNNINLSPKPLLIPPVLKEILLLLWHFPLLAEEHMWVSSESILWLLIFLDGFNQSSPE